MGFLKKIIITAIIFLVCEGAARPEPVAPLYPGAVEAECAVSASQKPYIRVYYSKDPAEKVLEFYKPRLGEFNESVKGRQYDYIVMRRNLGHKETLQPRELGVSIRTRRTSVQDAEREVPDEIRDAGLSRCVNFGHDYFKNLESLVAQLPGRSWADYDEACRRFSHLTWSFFLESGRKDSRGRRMNTARALIAEYLEENPGLMETADSGEALSRKMEEYMRQGRMDKMMEIANLQSRQMSAALNADEEKWDKYIKLLETIENHAYMTSILIHLRPSED